MVESASAVPSMQRRVEKETVRGLDMEIAWQGCNVAEMLPPGQPLRLYQRRLGVPKVRLPDLAGK
jgi:hypothetical protein